MQTAAQGWLVLKLTDSAFYLGVVSAAGSIPILFLTVFGGVLADRFEKQSLLKFTQGASMIPALALGYLTWTDSIQVWQVIALVGILGIVNSLDIPVRQSFLVDLVKPDSLHHAIALNAAAFNGARMIGPALAGFIIGWVGLHVCFWINAASFLASLLVLFMIRPQVRVDIGGEGGGVFRRMKEGFRYIRGDVSVFSLMVLVSVFSLFGLPYATLMPVFARDVLNLDPSGYGVLMSSVGMGALSGALYLAFRVSDGGLRTIHAGGIIFALAMIMFSRSGLMIPSMIFLYATGFAAVVVIASINIGIQRKVPNYLRGRVMSIYTTLFLGMFPIGSLLVGSTSQLMGVQTAVSVNGTVCLIVVAGSWIFQKTRTPGWKDNA